MVSRQARRRVPARRWPCGWRTQLLVCPAQRLSSRSTLNRERRSAALPLKNRTRRRCCGARSGRHAPRSETPAARANADESRNTRSTARRKHRRTRPRRHAPRPRTRAARRRAEELRIGISIVRPVCGGARKPLRIARARSLEPRLARGVAQRERHSLAKARTVDCLPM